MKPVGTEIGMNVAPENIHVMKKVMKNENEKLLSYPYIVWIGYIYSSSISFSIVLCYDMQMDGNLSMLDLL